MTISKRIFENVAFIGLPKKRPDGSQVVEWKGTCFFVEQTASLSPPKIWGYMVTARHVADQVAYKEFALRLNRKDGGSEIIFCPAQSLRWWTHPTDPNVDVALVRWLPPESDLAVVRWQVEDFATKADLEQGVFNVGDGIDMIGLFNRVPGSEKNSPILRRGTLAMLPDGPVMTGRGLTEAYLVEAYSIGGMSGSPTIVTAALIHPHPASGTRLRGIGRSALLGLVHGHWDYRDDPINGESQSGPRDMGNSGVTVIVPAYRILEVIEQEEILQLQKAELPGLLAAK